MNTDLQDDLLEAIEAMIGMSEILDRRMDLFRKEIRDERTELGLASPAYIRGEIPEDVAHLPMLTHLYARLTELEMLQRTVMTDLPLNEYLGKNMGVGWR